MKISLEEFEEREGGKDNTNRFFPLWCGGKNETPPKTENADFDGFSKKEPPNADDRRKKTPLLRRDRLCVKKRKGNKNSKEMDSGKIFGGGEVSFEAVRVRRQKKDQELEERYGAEEGTVVRRLAYRLTRGAVENYAASYGNPFVSKDVGHARASFGLGSLDLSEAIKACSLQDCLLGEWENRGVFTEMSPWVRKSWSERLAEGVAAECSELLREFTSRLENAGLVAQVRTADGFSVEIHLWLDLPASAASDPPASDSFEPLLSTPLSETTPSSLETIGSENGTAAAPPSDAYWFSFWKTGP